MSLEVSEWMYLGVFGCLRADVSASLLEFREFLRIRPRVSGSSWKSFSACIRVVLLVSGCLSVVFSDCLWVSV